MTITQYKLPLQAETYVVSIPSEFGASNETAQAYAIGKFASEATLSEINPAYRAQMRNFEVRRALSLADTSKSLSPLEEQTLNAFLSGYKRDSVFGQTPSPTPTAVIPTLTLNERLAKDETEQIVHQMKRRLAINKSKKEIQIDFTSPAVAEHLMNKMHPYIGTAFGHLPTQSYPINHMKVAQVYDSEPLTGSKAQSYFIHAEAQGHNFLFHYNPKTDAISPIWMGTQPLTNLDDNAQLLLLQAAKAAGIDLTSGSTIPFLARRATPGFLTTTSSQAKADKEPVPLSFYFNPTTVAAVAPTNTSEGRYTTSGPIIFGEEFHNKDLEQTPPGINATARKVAAVPADLEKRVG